LYDGYLFLLSDVLFKSGMWIWRVQSFQLVKVPEKQFGQFYQGMEILAFFF
jgi:hypothetical protein